MKETVKKVAAGVLLVATLGASVTALAMGIKHDGWFGKGDDDQNQEQTSGDLNQDEVKGEAALEEDVSQGISLMSMKIPVAMYDSYGISTQAESAFSVTATITPADAANKLVTWSVAWKNVSSSWATGKTVTDYVTVTTATDGALTATVENKQAFGEQIILKCVSRDNAGAYATSNVEYLQRTNGYTLTLDGKTYATTGTKTNAAKPTFAATQSANAALTVNKSSVYTRANTDVANYFTIKPTTAFKTAITNAGLSSGALKEYSGAASITLSGWFDRTWGTSLYTTNAQKNKLIGAIKDFTGNAYEIVVYTSNGGSQLATFGLTLDSSVIVGQKGVESVTTNKGELVF